MRYLVFVIILGLSSVLVAKEQSCQTENDGYQFEVKTQVAGAGKETQQFAWLRRKDTAMFHYPRAKISEQWRGLSSNHLSLLRAFHGIGRGIDYNRADLNLDSDDARGRTLVQPFDATLLAALQKQSEKGRGCDRRVRYKGVINEQRVVVDWLAEREIPSSVVLKAKGRWSKLKILHTLTAQEQEQLWAAMDLIDYMDYADTGDNEADPTIAYMLMIDRPGAAEIVYPGVHAHQH